MWNWIWFDSQIFFSLLLGISNCYKFIFIYSLKVSRQLLFFSLPASFSSLSLMGDMEIICQMKKKRWKCERNERRKILTSRNPPSPHSRPNIKNGPPTRAPGIACCCWSDEVKAIYSILNQQSINFTAIIQQTARAKLSKPHGKFSLSPSVLCVPSFTLA